MKPRENCKLSINGYGAFTSPDLETISVVLNTLKGYLVQDINTKADLIGTLDPVDKVTYGAIGHKPIVVRWSEDNQYWWGSF